MKKIKFIKLGILAAVLLLGNVGVKGQTAVHTPDDGKYGVSLIEYNARNYEIYSVNNPNSTYNFFMGGNTSYPLCTGSISSGLNADWVVTSIIYSGNSSSGLPSSAQQFTDITTRQLNFRGSQSITLKVSGYDEFSFVGKDNNATDATKYFSVKINDATQTMTTNASNFTIRSFSLNPAIESTIVVSAGGGASQNHVMSAFSLRLPDCTDRTQYTLSGDATICTESSADIVLNNSEAGVSYQLYNGTTAVDDANKAGTGSALTWSVSEAGVYTVKTVADESYCETEMIGSATITVVSPPTGGTATATAESFDAGNGTTITLSGHTAGTTIQWQVNKDEAGWENATGETVNAAIYTTGALNEGSYKFRALVSNGVCDAVASSVATVEVANATNPYITVSGSQNQTIKATQTIDQIIFTANNSDGNALAIAWDGYENGQNPNWISVTTGNGTLTVSGDYAEVGTYSYTVSLTGATSANGTITVNPRSEAKDILTFTIPNQVSSDISGTDITITMPANTDRSSLTPTITVSDLAAVNPVSGATQDFTCPVVYTVTAEDETEKVYTVTVVSPSYTSMRTIDFSAVTSPTASISFIQNLFPTEDEVIITNTESSVEYQKQDRGCNTVNGKPQITIGNDRSYQLVFPNGVTTFTAYFTVSGGNRIITISSKSGEDEVTKLLTFPGSNTGSLCWPDGNADDRPIPYMTLNTRKSTTINISGSGGGSWLYKIEYTLPADIAPIALTSALGSDNQTVAPGDAIDPIEYTITPSTATPEVTWNVDIADSGIAVDLLTAGKVTISGTPTTAGTYNYTVELNKCTFQTGTITVEAESYITWTGTTNDWNIDTNWNPNKTPSKATNVTIPVVTTDYNYPVLKDTEANKARNITIKGGAEIGNQHLLTYTSATVEYPALAGSRWHMLSIPVDNATSEDFYFEGRYTFRSDFSVNDDGVASWKPKQALTEKFDLGQGFAFYAYDRLTNETPSSFIDDEDPIIVSGQLADNPVNKTLDFGTDTKYGTSPFALAANPFMTTIDFDDLVSANSSITDTYLIWVGSTGFKAYNPNGNYGSANPDAFGDDGRYIAPLQSFIVQRSLTASESPSLTFDLSTISADVDNKADLRSSAAPVNKLEITASNPAASVLTFIAEREGGQTVLSDRDGRKLFSTMNAVPDVYTLKESADGPVAVGANILPAANITVPLGIATTYKGNITLTFKGMADYDTQITFIDKQERPEGIDLTGLDTYAYDFSLADAGVRVENRFEIQLIPGSVTGLHAVDHAKPLVYSLDNALRIVSAASDIRSLVVYNLQGQAIYAADRVNAASFTTDRLPVSGVCIVKVITEKGVNNVKVIVK
jgi:hypothetical protein